MNKRIGFFIEATLGAYLAMNPGCNIPGYKETEQSSEESERRLRLAEEKRERKRIAKEEQKKRCAAKRFE